MTDEPVFTPRVCPGCDETIPAGQFGRHVMGHVPHEFPGGPSGMLDTLIASVRLSMAEAEGFPAQRERMGRVLGELLRIETRLERLTASG